MVTEKIFKSENFIFPNFLFSLIDESLNYLDFICITLKGFASVGFRDIRFPVLEQSTLKDNFMFGLMRNERCRFAFADLVSFAAFT
jgi:hypothetical protein